MPFRFVSPIRPYRNAVLAAAAIVFMSAPSFAVEMKFGEIDAHLDTIVSASVGVRTAAQNCTHISIYNGGCVDKAGRTWDVNNDDGNINVQRGEIFSDPVKVLSELSLKYRDYGVFVSGKAYYDQAAHDLGGGGGNYGPIAANANGAPDQRRPLQDYYKGSDAYRRELRGLKLLDAYAYGNFDVAGQPLNVRLGRQVVNWGESAFIQGGISSFLPLDVSALYQPGTELKEVFEPQNTLYASLGLPNNFSIEGMYVVEWDKSTLPACGSYFGVSDALGDGCQYGMLAGEMYTNADGTMRDGNDPYNLNMLVPVVVHRTESQNAREQGQWGVALRYYADWLNDGTDLGAYFVNFHSKLPIATFTADTLGGSSAAVTPHLSDATCNLPSGLTDDAGNNITLCQALMGLLAQYGKFGALINDPSLKNKLLLAQYPTDIHMFGSSFNTTIPILGGTALSGELAYYSNMPFQVDITELQGIDAIHGGFTAAPGEAPLYTGEMVGEGDVIPGYRRTKAMVGQFYTISTLTPSNWFVQSTGGDLLILVANAGFQYLPDADGNRFAIPMSFETHANPGMAATFGDPCISAGTCHIQAQYASAFSWGYRLMASQQYASAFGSAWNLTPKVIWYHDVSGYSAGPIGPGFVEGTKSLTLGIDADYQERYKVGLSFTTFMGNPYRNVNYDKDFVSMTASYAF